MKKTSGKLKKILLRLIPAALVCLNIFSYAPVLDVSAAKVSVIIDTSRDHVNISPYIYGVNTNTGISPVKAFAVKQFGAYLDTYNWELDTANVGVSLDSENIELSPSSNTGGKTALYPSGFMINANTAKIPGRFLTLPMSGYAAADGDGTVNAFETDRFLTVKNSKAGEYMLSPNTDDGFVYNDEYLAFMINRFGWRNAELAIDADSVGEGFGGVTGFFLGSEPELMIRSFPYLDLPPMTALSLAEKSVDLAKTVKHIDASADVFAPSIKNLESYINLQNSTDWETHSEEYSWYIDYFLDSFKKASDTAGYRLLDCLDLHFYTEAVTDDGTAVISSESKAANTARINAPRLFWDGSYSESSRSAVNYKAYTPLIPTLQASIRMFYPGTKLSFSEYSFGGGGNSSGGIAVAETLGIFGKNGVYMAGLSPTDNADSSLNANLNRLSGGSAPNYEYSGLQIYTDYDGKGSSFLPVSVYAGAASSNSAVYASISEKDDSKLTVIYVNKSEQTDIAHMLLFANSDYDEVRVFGFDETGPEITDRYDEHAMVESSIFEYEVPPRSVYIFEFSGTLHRGAMTTAAIENAETEISTTPAVTDPYGATITSKSEAETAVTLTEVPENEDNVGSAENAQSGISSTTVYAPKNPAETIEGTTIPLAVRVIAVVLIFAVIGVFTYLIFTIFKR